MLIDLVPLVFDEPSNRPESEVRMSKKPVAKHAARQGSSSANQATSKRGRPAKEPPPPKLWRIEAISPDGLKVTLGRYVSQEEAEPELTRLQADGFYRKLRIVESPPEPEEATD